MTLLVWIPCCLRRLRQAMSKPILPRALKPVDKIAIVSPSFPAGGLFENRRKACERGLERSLGLRAEWTPNALRVSGFTAGTARERAADWNSAVCDSETKGIMCAIGGFNSAEMLPFLDYQAMREHPKV